jgi:DNA-binding CsgD family transcriptional regulator
MHFRDAMNMRENKAKILFMMQMMVLTLAQKPYEGWLIGNLSLNEISKIFP